jgi:hypothetical protein
MRLRNIAAIFALASIVSNAQAALFDRGGGLIYDNVLNVTWLQDANFAKSSGHDADGLMNWAAANSWAADLVYGGYDDWRLARNSHVGEEWVYKTSYNGSTDFGYNITSQRSEMSYMYYVNLGLKGGFSSSADPIFQANYGIFGNGTLNGTSEVSFGQNDVGLVKNLQSYVYWSGTEYAPNPTGSAWYFYAGNGSQNADGYPIDFEFYSWAVRDGDVASVTAPIPEPETYAMLLVGLGLLGVVARRRRKS